VDCSRAFEYFMKYMDNTLREEEAKKLHTHLAVCEKCKADFIVYESLVTEFSVCELIEAPADLEVRVMAEIKKFPELKAHVNKSINAIVAALGIGFFTTMALGFIMFINRDLIFEFMANSPTFAPYVSMLTPVSDFITSFTDNIWTALSGAGTTAFSLVGSYKYIILAIAVLLLIAQIVVYNRGRVKNKVEAEE
jgi:hypothetical protein